MDAELSREAAALLAAARASLAEWIEEGIDALGPVGAAEPPPPFVAGRVPRGAASGAAGPPSERRPPSPPATAPGQIGMLEEGTGLGLGPRPTLEQVSEVLGECTRCPLCEGRTRIVFGDGNPQAELLFVGEGPGEQEDLRGLPFVGRAGELLTAMIERGLGLSRRDVYICNIVKCRPPGNRTPLATEVATCRPFLDAQIDAVAPRVIVALGKPATSLLLGRDVSITRVRGTWHDYRGTPVMPTFHPAFVLRQYTEQNRRLVWEDLKAALSRAREG